MHDRILNLINLLLVLACGGLVYYLATARNEMPAEVLEARALMNGETGYQPPVELPAPVREPDQINRQLFNLLYTPTPTPTPAPPPPPPPPNLEQAVAGWRLVEIRPPDTAVFRDDRRPAQPIILKVDGPAYTGESAVDATGKQVQVQLTKIELGSDPGAQLSAPDQESRMMRMKQR